MDSYSFECLQIPFMVRFLYQFIVSTEPGVLMQRIRKPCTCKMGHILLFPMLGPSFFPECRNNLITSELAV